VAALKLIALQPPTSSFDNSAKVMSATPFFWSSGLAPLTTRENLHRETPQ